MNKNHGVIEHHSNGQDGNIHHAIMMLMVIVMMMMIIMIMLIANTKKMGIRHVGTLREAVLAYPAIAHGQGLGF